MGRRRYTRKLPKRGGATYVEPQKSALCGKHAINHILQEEKFIWDKKISTIYVPPVPFGVNPTDHVKDSGTKINVYAACKEFEMYQKEHWASMGLEERLAIFTRDMTLDVDPDDYKAPEDFVIVKKQQTELREKYGKLEWADALKAYTDDSKQDAFQTYEALQLEKPCQFGKKHYGNMVIEFFQRWGSILGLKGFTAAIGSLYPDFVENMIDILRVQLKKPEFLGAMLSLPGHYTAIVMYDSDCEPKRKVGDKEPTYLYIDSMAVEMDETGECKKGITCYTETKLIDVLRDLSELRAMIFFYGADPEDPTLQPCDSVAVRRMNNVITGAPEAPPLPPAVPLV